MLDDLILLFLGAVPVMLLVFLIVEGLKTYGFVNEKAWFTAPRAGLTVGLLLGITAIVGAFVPGAQPIIAVVAPIVVGSLIAGLFYDLLGGLIREKVAAVVNALFGSTRSE